MLHATETKSYKNTKKTKTDKNKQTKATRMHRNKLQLFLLAYRFTSYIKPLRYHILRCSFIIMPTDNVPAALEAAGTPAKRKETAAQGIIDKALRVAMRTRQQLYEPCSCVALHIPQNRTPETARYQWDRSCKSIDEHFARRAFMDDGVMIAFQKKRLPDLKGGEDMGTRPILIQVVNYSVVCEHER